MKRTVLGAFILICAAPLVQAQTLSSEDLARRTIERRRNETNV